MLLSSTSRRRLTRIAVAGALIALPAGALAATASAQAPDPAAIQLTPADGTDISAHPHGGLELPGGQGHDGPRVEYRERGDGPRIHRKDEPGPRIFFKDGRPSTGSAGSS
ncbi:hypothetical protein [Nocardia suismassiliense]|uniref:hypothetical protein n=1 Tax=Nocardia suismassiliense TaxID=2077092 RepID=UPI00131F2990|nr:hypothetical protein [Nocardia suismassiliense]